MPDAPPRDAKGKFPKRPHAPRGGDGWGDAPKGAGSQAERAPSFEDGNQLGRIATPEVRRAANEDREEALAFYRSVMRDRSEGGTCRVAAADRLMDRVDGKPVARVLNLNPLAELTGEQLDTILAAAERLDASGLGGAAAGGEAAPPVGKPH